MNEWYGMVNGNCTETHDDGSMYNKPRKKKIKKKQFLHFTFLYLKRQNKKKNLPQNPTPQFNTHVTQYNSFVYPN